MNQKKIKIYSLYEVDKYGRTNFRGRFASLQKLKAAAVFFSSYFFDEEEKHDEFA